ncbi:hypothetical protein GO495_23100 [Chitinophaga oryziterrae]|uniref:Uncharacterized protein n=1 Tax=Chitinophaga oryziterrae TaxID=1031224 RepID=A0A6N8JDV1_9BACT|nr:hypothetical protein [Chitinophaga oryziterrae]MVT43505.1 hypothetical protein [Chitinophaga oryziterrae]
MVIIQLLSQIDFPLSWANLERYSDSKAFRKEIYTHAEGKELEELAMLFHHLFAPLKDRINIYDSSWWDLCLGTWDMEKDYYDYSPEGKSPETAAYLTMLTDAAIPPEYSGCVQCLHWDEFLTIILRCIVSHAAPYSPIFYSEADQLFFYFHHTGSIGLYYEKESEVVKGILDRAAEQYEIVSR